ncbi:34261_t:CDS:1, partial [Racocetra persica]
IVCNQQPFCVVEDEDLQIFVFELDPATDFLVGKRFRSIFSICMKESVGNCVIFLKVLDIRCQSRPIY